MFTIDLSKQRVYNDAKLNDILYNEQSHLIYNNSAPIVCVTTLNLAAQGQSGFFKCSN